MTFTTRFLLVLLIAEASMLSFRLSGLAQQGKPSETTGKSWLDVSSPQNWNHPGQALPRPISGDDSNLWRCGEQIRLTSRNKADPALIAAGWKLIGPLHIFDNMRVVLGASGFDGMCRPMGYNAFVFESSKFAGMLAPAPMNSRQDGDLGQINFPKQGAVTATYKRYREADPLCCPSSNSVVTFKIETHDGNPVLTPESVTTTPNQGTEKP